MPKQAVEIDRDLARNVGLVAAGCLWLFLLVALASFHSTDWPSHTVYPYSPNVQNLCGTIGAWIAYHAYRIIGSGVFMILFFAGVCLILAVLKNRLGDFWLRTAGLVLLSIAFAAAVHHLRPGSPAGFPEGDGGVLGIGVSAFLQSHFSVWGTRLVLMTGMLIGLFLAADDLVLRAPGVVVATYVEVRDRAPSLSNFKFSPLPKLPALPKFVTRDAVVAGTNGSMLRVPKPKTGGAGKATDPKLEVIGDDFKVIDEPVIEKKPKPTKIEKAAAAEAVEPIVEAAPEPEIAAVIEPPVQRREILVKLPNSLKPRQIAPPPPKELTDYTLPPWDCLDEAEHGYVESQESFVREQAAILEQALKEFNIDAHVVEIDTGPVITMYELALAPGIKVSAITGLDNDIQRALKAESIRIIAPVPGKGTVGIEVPNATKEKVRMKDLMQLAPEKARGYAIPLYLGKDASGEPLIADLSEMPHCLIAGTTGSGKSVCINTIIMSIMFMQRPDTVKLILVDPKVVEMAPFKDVPHLMAPVITDTARAASVLEWACEKMDERYDFLAEAGVRNIKGYNTMTWEERKERFNPATPEEEAKIPKHLPYIVIIIDELADLMMTSGKEVESHIVRIAQKARAVGIHLILATQRPQATVVTGLIKSNMPTKIAFRVASRMDSRIVLDMNGAEVLLGQGDMLYLKNGASKPIRSQGTYITDKEIRDSVKLVKSLAEAQYEPDLVQIKAAGNIDDEAAKDELFDAAVRVVLETKRGSVSLLQRRLTIGYSRASRLVEAMASAGIVGDYKGSQAREALITVEEWDALKSQQSNDAAEGMSV